MLPCERVHVRDREKENVLTFFSNFIIKWHMTFFFCEETNYQKKLHFKYSWQTFCQNMMQLRVFLDIFNTIWFLKSLMQYYFTG